MSQPWLLNGTREVCLTLPTVFIQSAPSLPALLHRLQLSDCGDSRWFPPTTLRAAGIRRHLWVSGLLITCSAASSPTSPSPYPPMFLLSDRWDLTCNAVTGCLSGHFKVSAAIFVGGRKVTSMFSHVCCFGRSCVFLINCSYFEYCPSLLYVHLFVLICFRECKWGSRQHQPSYVQCPHRGICHRSTNQYDNKSILTDISLFDHQLPQSNPWPLWSKVHNKWSGAWLERYSALKRTDFKDSKSI